MVSANVTLRTLVLGNQDTQTGWYGKTFTTSTIPMLIFAKGTFNAKLGIGGFSRYDFTGYTDAVLLKGDQSLDADGYYYDVRDVQPVMIGDTLVYNTVGLVMINPFTPNRAATSGTWSSYDDPRHRTKLWLDTYLTPTYTATANGAADGTTIINTSHMEADDFFNGRTVTMLTGTCATETAVVSNYVLSTGTITLVGTGFSTQIDAADTYTISNLLKDDGATNASFIVCYDMADYPAERVFIDKNVDLIFTCSEPVSTPIRNADRTTDSYRENCPVTVSVVNKTGVTGANLKWQAENELRRIFETYVFSSVRQIERANPLTTDYESAIIHSYTYLIDYVREKR